MLQHNEIIAIMKTQLGKVGRQPIPQHQNRDASASLSLTSRFCQRPQFAQDDARPASVADAQKTQPPPASHRPRQPDIALQLVVRKSQPDRGVFVSQPVRDALPVEVSVRPAAAIHQVQQGPAALARIRRNLQAGGRHQRRYFCLSKKGGAVISKGLSKRGSNRRE